MKLFWMLVALSRAQDATTLSTGTVTAYNYDDSYAYDTVDGIDGRKKSQAEKEAAKANRQKNKNKQPKYKTTTTAAPYYTTTEPTTTPYYTTSDPQTTTVYASTADDSYTTATDATTASYADPGGDNYGQGGGQDGNDNNSNPYASNGTPDGAASLKCFTCQGQTVEECQASGSVQDCQENETSCELEIRTRLNQETGYYDQQGVITGCKQIEACQNNQRQNFGGDPWGPNKDHTQCRPETDKGYHHSVCRQCCWEDDCVDNGGNFWDPQTRWQWNQANGRYGL